MIDRDAPDPPWVQLAAILRSRIASGEITSRLPGERALQQEFGLAPVTIRKAVHQLRNEGLDPHHARLGHLRGKEERQGEQLKFDVSERVHASLFAGMFIWPPIDDQRQRLLATAGVQTTNTSEPVLHMTAVSLAGAATRRSGACHVA